MNKIGIFACLALGLLATATARAQHTVPRRDAIVPTDQWAYAALRRVQDRKSVTPRPDTPFSGRARTRAEFARLIEEELRTLDETFDRDAARDPEVLAWLRRLLLEFDWELRGLGVPVFRVWARIGMLERSLGSGTVSGPFKDVPKDHWATSSVEALRQIGVLVGYPNGGFHEHRRQQPGQPVRHAR